MSIVQLDSDFEALVPPDATVERLASGFTFIAGPIWRPSSALWFSDVIGNVTWQWTPDGHVKALLRPGGYDGNELPAGGFIGPSGATAGPHGTVILCQLGNRRVVRVTDALDVLTIADRFEGKRLNSPHDVVFRSDGAMYFTDPPYGLPKADEDPMKELSFNGVYVLRDGRVDLLVSTMTRPNGLAFSPDERTLYVANSDEHRRLWMRFEVAADGSVGHGEVFWEVSREADDGVPGGLKIDAFGNVWATGPGGVWVMTPGGAHLGTIKVPDQPASLAWGSDWQTLYITARTTLYKLQTSVTGQGLVY
jgi:gluconolactonase